MSDSPAPDMLPDFSVEVEHLVADKGLDYMDAILHYAEKNGVEEAAVADMVKMSPVIKAMLEAEAEDKRMLKRRGARLPI